MALGGIPSSTTTLNATDPSQPNATDNSNSANNVGGTNGLYLYTFLITLLVLLSVASLIIVRSCILRRRFRRQMRIAIEGGGGFVLPPLLRVPGEGGIPIVLAGRGGRRRKDKVVLGAKPVMWEVWMEKDPHVHDESEDEKLMHAALIQPISTAVVRPTVQDPNAQSGGSATPSPFLLNRETAQEYFGIDMRSFREVVNDNWRNTRSNLQILGRTLTPRPRPSSVVVPSPQRSRPVSQRMNSSSGSPNRQSGFVTPQDDDANKRLAVGFLIAMPDARRPTYHHSTPFDLHPGAFKVDLEQASPTSDSFPYTPEELERGKMKALEIAGDEGDSFVGQFGIDDGELPPAVFGVMEVDWTGRKMPPSMMSQARPGGTHV